MTSSSVSCFQNLPQVLHQPYEIAGSEEDHHRQAIVSAAFDPIGSGSSSSASTTTRSASLLYNLSVLSDKVHQVQSLVTLLISPDQAQPEPASMLAASMGTLIQEIIFTASSMMFTCQQITTDNNNSNLGHDTTNPRHAVVFSHQSSSNQVINHVDCNVRAQSSLYPETGLDWYNDHHNNNRSVITSANNDLINASSTTRDYTTMEPKRDQRVVSKASSGSGQLNPSDIYIIELDAAELLAKYTHYCQICGKGFKRDANLRMHMRAHGDEYKSRSALSNPLKKRTGTDHKGNEYDYLANKLLRKYSCPQEGCRWNQRHPKFQPLKSMICVKNHYKRSHCPKMYVCKRCNKKQFSVLSDLRTHEKHCMDLKWQCSCGTTFSRKDKLMGHVALFVGHSPMIDLAKPATGKVGQWSSATAQVGDVQGNM